MPSTISSSGGLVSVTLTGIDASNTASAINVDFLINGFVNRASITRYLFVQQKTIIEFMIPRITIAKNSTADFAVYLAARPSLKARSSISLYVPVSTASILATTLLPNPSVIVSFAHMPYSPSSLFFSIVCTDPSINFQFFITSSNLDALTLNISISLWPSARQATFAFTHLPSQISLLFNVPYFVDTTLIFEKVQPEEVFCGSVNQVFVKTTGRFVSIDAIVVSVSSGATLSLQNYVPSTASSGFLVCAFNAPSCASGFKQSQINLTASNRTTPTTHSFKIVAANQLKIEALIPQSGPLNGFPLSVVLAGSCVLSNISILVGEKLVAPLNMSQIGMRTTLIAIRSPGIDFALPQQIVVKCGESQTTGVLRYHEICSYPEFCLKTGLFASQNTFYRQDEVCDPVLCVDQALVSYPNIILSSLRDSNVDKVDRWWLVVNNLFASKSSDVRIVCDQNFMKIDSSKCNFGFCTELVIIAPSKTSSSNVDVACRLFSIFYGAKISVDFRMKLSDRIPYLDYVSPSNTIVVSLKSSFIFSFGNFDTDAVTLASNLNITSNITMISSSNSTQKGLLVLKVDILVAEFSLSPLILNFSATNSKSFVTLQLQIIYQPCAIISVYPSILLLENIYNSAIILRYTGLKEDAYLFYNDMNTRIIISASLSSEPSTTTFVLDISKKYNATLLGSFKNVDVSLWSIKTLTSLTNPIFAFAISSPHEPRVVSIQPSTISINIATTFKIVTANFIPTRASNFISALDFKNGTFCNILNCEIELQLLAKGCDGVSIVLFNSLDDGSKLLININASPPAATSSPSSFQLQSSIILKITSYCKFTQASKNFSSSLGVAAGIISVPTFEDDLCPKCSTVVISRFETTNSAFAIGQFYIANIMSGVTTDSVFVKVLPSIGMLFSTSIPQINFVNGILQDSLPIVFTGLPFSLLNDENCNQATISLNAVLIKGASRSCLSSSIMISLIAFDGSLLINSPVAVVRFEMNYFGDLYQSQASAVISIKDVLRVEIISKSIGAAFSSKADQKLVASVSSTNSSSLIPALNVRIGQTILSFVTVFSQGTELVIRITIPANIAFGSTTIFFSAFSLTASANVLFEQQFQVSCKSPCFKSFDGGLLTLTLSKSSGFTVISDFLINMLDQYLQIISFNTLSGDLSILMPPVPLVLISNGNNSGAILTTVYIQHSKLPNVQYSIQDFYYQSPVNVTSGIFDSSGSSILVSFNQLVVSDINSQCENWFQDDEKLGKGWSCFYYSESSVTVLLGTDTTIIPGDTMSLLALKLRPKYRPELVFKNSKLTFVIAPPLQGASSSVVIQGSTVIDPCSSVIITAIADSPRELTYSWSCPNDATLNFSISTERTASIRIVPNSLKTAGKVYTISVSVKNFLGISWSSLPFQLLFDTSESLKVAILPLPKTKYDYTDDIEILSSVQFSSCKSAKKEIAYKWTIENAVGTSNAALVLASISGPRAFMPANLFVPNSPNILTITALGSSISARSSVVVWISAPSIPIVEIFGCVASASISQSLKMPIIVSSSTWLASSISIQCSTENSQRCRNAEGIPIVFTSPSDVPVLEVFAQTFDTPFVAVFTTQITFHNTTDIASAMCTISFTSGHPIPTVTIKKIAALQKMKLDPRLPVFIEAVFDTQNYKCIWEQSLGLIQNISAYIDPQIGFNRPTLLILGGTLVPGLTYAFKVSLLLRSQVVVSASVSFRTNAAPTQGGFLIRYNDDLTATLSCSNWIDEDLPIYYKFGFRSSRTNVAMEYSRIPFFTFYIFGSGMTVTASICDALFFCSPAFNFAVKPPSSSSFVISDELDNARKLSSFSDVVSLGLTFASSLQGLSNAASRSRSLLQQSSTNTILSILNSTVEILKNSKSIGGFDTTTDTLSYLKFITQTSGTFFDNLCHDTAVFAFERLIIVGTFTNSNQPGKFGALPTMMLDSIGSLLDISSTSVSRLPNIELRVSALSDFFKSFITKSVSETMIDEQSSVISGSFDSSKLATFRVSAVLESGRTFTSTRDSKNRSATFYLSSIFFNKHLLKNSSNIIIACSVDTQEIPWKSTPSPNNSASVYMLNSLFGLRFSQYPKYPSFLTSIVISLDFESEAVPYPDTLWRTKLRVSAWSATSSAGFFSPKECSILNISRNEGKNTLFAECNQVKAIGIEVVRNATLCGNGYLESLEQCDDNNILPFDGCDQNCRVEKNWKCFRTGTFNVEEFNPDTCLLVDVPYLFCPRGYFGSSCDVFILPQYIQRFDVSSLVNNSFQFPLGRAILRINIPANAIKSNFTMTIRVYSSASLTEQPSAEMPESLKFSQFIFVVEPYSSFLSEVQLEFISSSAFIHSNSNASRINNFLNPSSIAAYQLTEAFCVDRSQCQLQIGSLGLKLGSWAPFRSQKSNSSTFKVSFGSKALSKFSFMMTTPIVTSVAPSRDLFDLPTWALILLICSAVAMSACVGFMLWRRLRAHDAQILEKLALKYSLNADDVLNSPENIKLTQNLVIKRSSLYVIKEHTSDETASSVSMNQFSDDEDQSSASLDSSQENQQEHPSAMSLTAETCIVNEAEGNLTSDQSLPILSPENHLEGIETIHVKPLKLASPSEEELDLEFLKELTHNPEIADFLDFDAALFRGDVFSAGSTAKVSMIPVEAGALRTAGSLVLSPKFAKEIKHSRQSVQTTKSDIKNSSEASFSSHLKHNTDSVQSERLARLAQKIVQSPTAPVFITESDASSRSVKVIPSSLNDNTEPATLTPRPSNINSDHHQVKAFNESPPRPSPALAAADPALDVPNFSPGRGFPARQTSSAEVIQLNLKESTPNVVHESAFSSSDAEFVGRAQFLPTHQMKVPSITPKGPIQASTRMAPRLIRSANTDDIAVNSTVSARTTHRSRIPESRHHVVLTSSTLLSESNSSFQDTQSVIQRITESTSRPHVEDRTSAVRSLSSPRVATAQPSYAESSDAITLNGAAMSLSVIEDTSKKPTSPLTFQPSTTTSHQSILADIGLSIPLSRASKKAHSLGPSTPRPTASAAATASASAAPTHFSYKKSEVVKDPRGRH
jgi:cysteine-rich repeat protein